MRQILVEKDICVRGLAHPCVTGAGTGDLAEKIKEQREADEQQVGAAPHVSHNPCEFPARMVSMVCAVNREHNFRSQVQQESLIDLSSSPFPYTGLGEIFARLGVVRGAGNGKTHRNKRLARCKGYCNGLRERLVIRASSRSKGTERYGTSFCPKGFGHTPRSDQGLRHTMIQSR